MPWELDNDRPIYLQLMERIQQDIVSGIYKPGDRLPSVRDLAVEAAVNPNTMQKALSELERSGLVYSQRTSGRFITEDTRLLDEMKTSLASVKGSGYRSFASSENTLKGDKRKSPAHPCHEPRCTALRIR